MVGIETTASTTEKPCRSCVDFKTWTKAQSKNFSMAKATSSDSKPAAEPKPRADCPLDKDQLGRASWKLLHTIAAHYPDKPTQEQASKTKEFFHALSHVYPCDHCASDFREDLKCNPPQTRSQTDLSQWLCRLHNRVNLKLGKPEFDCAKVNERWRDGWLDGSCD